MTIRYGVFDDELTQGWGVITITSSRAHYWPDPNSGVALCGYRCRGWRVEGTDSGEYDIVTGHVPYRGQLRRTRNLKTNCKKCAAILRERESTK